MRWQSIVVQKSASRGSALDEVEVRRRGPGEALVRQSGRWT